MIELILATGFVEALVIPAIIAGTTVSAVATVQKGRAAKAQGEAQAAIAERNAQLAERQAEAERQAAIAEARKQEAEGKVLTARQQALFAQAGVLSRGTPLSVVVETARELEAERLTILREGTISEQQRITQAGIERARGEAAKAKGAAAARGAGLTAAGTILSGVGQVGVASKDFPLPFTKGGLLGKKV